MKIKNHSSNGKGFIQFDVTWDDGGDSDRSDIPVDMGQSEVEVSLEPYRADIEDGYRLYLRIVPEDSPLEDRIYLPIDIESPLPTSLYGSTIPSVAFETPYVLFPLAATAKGMRVMAGRR